ncbi:hypothetical protein RFI_05584 [Reticulomyxa filosa]|uniref:Uncharacterized protein n=1 Tax=Reticulomyxa filosa TaxID=46433 RepID=X6NZW9_RETFI|nr:hypothetical protein RFI_05584 [Reticulomyxa filosa]|eukprot:ETO31536.1 hypothetical protein RFI_05584 [Reticulomyxa filosa]
MDAFSINFIVLSTCAFIQRSILSASVKEQRLKYEVYKKICVFVKLNSEKSQLINLQVVHCYHLQLDEEKKQQKEKQQQKQLKKKKKAKVMKWKKKIGSRILKKKKEKEEKTRKSPKVKRQKRGKK